MTLSDLPIGARARIARMDDAAPGLRRKLLALGLTPGAEVGIERIAPLGDPIQIRVRGCALSIRRREAATLNVEALT